MIRTKKGHYNSERGACENENRGIKRSMLGTAGTTKNLLNGKYQTTYTTGLVPMVNMVEAGGTATITAPKVLYNPMVTGTVVPSFGADPDGVLKPLAITEHRTEQLQCTLTDCSLPTASVTLKGGQQALFYAAEPPLAAGLEQRAKYTLYGVDVALAIAPKYIIVDERKYTKTDTTLKYTILPAEYNAGIADIDLLKVEVNGQETWMGYLTGDKTQGEGRGVYVAGSQFDSDLKHLAQAVLNRGSDMEIKSDKKPLPIGQFKMVTDDEERLPLIGAVTDGAARLRLQLIAKHNREAFSNLLWKVYDSELKNDPLANSNTLRGTLLDESNNPTEALYVTFNSDGIAEAVYRAPETFVRWGTSKESNDKEIPERNIQPTLDIAYSLLTGIELLQPIKLKRPPVVLVHGLWGNGNRKSKNYSWKEFEPKFNEKGLYDIVSVDYHETHADSFAVNAELIRSLGIDEALDDEHAQFFAATKVDIIGNSMGGLLPREYCRNNSDDCSKKIRKFITTDTPHLGSELASLIQDVSANSALKCYGLLLDVEKEGKAIWTDAQRTTIRGALVDLAKGSLALTVLNSSTSLPYRAIVGSALGNIIAYDVSLKNMWIGLGIYCGYKPDMSYEFPVPYVAAPLFSEDNDRIVSISSQQGTSDEHYRIFGIDHLTVLGDPKTSTKIQEWLEKP